MNTEFFAGVNTDKGFCGYLEEYFKNARRLYIIKGTPGSGKSTLMKKLAADCEERGFSVQRILCSSDPHSLDGIYLPEKKRGIADGTAPHVLEPNCPLAREIIFDTGRFIDIKKLDTEGILNAGAKKKECYRRGYGYIKSAVAAEKSVPCGAETDDTRIDESVKRFLKKYAFSGVSGKGEIRVASAFTGKGTVHRNPFPHAKKVICLKGLGKDVFLKKVLLNACSLGEKTTLCPHPTRYGEYEGAFFHGKEVYVTTADTDGEEVRTNRFVKEKEGAREGYLLAKKGYSLAQKQLLKASGYHAELEGYYSSAMDFDALYGEYAALLRGLTE